MNSYKKVTFLFIYLFCFWAGPCLAWSGKVVGISDGDTISVMHGGKAEKIRLYGIDCPELYQDFGSKARAFTADMVFGKIVEVTPVDVDIHGRTVAWVSVEGKSLNKELLRAGLAWWYRRHAQHEEELRKLESEARERQVGLWSMKNPTPPWKFRKSQKTK